MPNVHANGRAARCSLSQQLSCWLYHPIIHIENCSRNFPFLRSSLQLHPTRPNRSHLQPTTRINPLPKQKGNHVRDFPYLRGRFQPHPPAQSANTFGLSISFEVNALFCSKKCYNLRNNLAHGLINYFDCHSEIAVYSWYFILKLIGLSYYNTIDLT